VKPRATKVVGQRVLGFLIDALVFALLWAIAWFALTGRFDKSSSTGGGFVIGDTRYAFDSSTNRAVWFALLVILFLALFVVLPGLRAASPGKALAGIRVVNAAGGPPGIARALVRELVWIADAFPYFVPGLLGFVVALRSRGNRRIGDMTAGTWVVKAGAAGRPPTEPDELVAPAAQ
jgi:uncharacterized RDD family membrane protein YckC